MVRMERDSEQEIRLVELARAEPQAFARLYEAYFARVYGYVQSRVGDTQSAEDLTADVFVKMVQSLDAFKRRQSGSFAGWLFRIARNLTLNYYRDIERRREGSEEAHFHLSLCVRPKKSFCKRTGAP